MTATTLDNTVVFLHHTVLSQTIPPEPQVIAILDRGSSVLVMQEQRGPAGVGVPTGGAAGAVLVKTSGSDFATGWVEAGNAFQYNIFIGDEEPQEAQDGDLWFQLTG